MDENLSSSMSQTKATRSAVPTSEIPIPSQLKFLIGTIKSTVQTILTTETHQIWRSQILKLFRANGFEGFLTGTTVCPPKLIISTENEQHENPDYLRWIMVDQNLSSALFSTISPSILPYVLELNTCAEIWEVITRRLQASNRARIQQIKNELHNLTMGNKNMSQYLSDIKSKVDLIAAAGSPIDIEDIIYYTLNGLPTSYQSFKVAIRTNLQSLSLDDLYSLLCSEETIQLAEMSRNDYQTSALTANRGGRVYQQE